MNLPEVPVNLLILMGFSIVTISGSKGITISYLQQGQLSQNDNSNLFSNREGSTDLTKVQMLAWTVISAGIYLYQFVNFVNKYHSFQAFYFPDIDKTSLILMGISQGGYIGGKLVQKNVTTVPVIEMSIPNPAQKGSDISILGGPFGDPEGNSVLIYNHAKNNGKFIKTYEVPGSNILSWNDSKICIKSDNLFNDGIQQKYYIQVRVNGIKSEKSEIKLSA